MAKIIGLKKGEFVNATGEKIVYGRVYVTYDDETVNGLACDELKLNPAKFDGFEIGDLVHVNRDKTGKVLSLDVA